MTDEYLRGRKILVAEDDTTLARNLTAALEAAGATVLPAARVSEAMTLAQSGAPDGAVLVVDLDGTLITPVVAHLAVHRIPFVLAMDDISAYPTFWEQAPRLGKPVDPETLTTGLLAAAEWLATRLEAGRRIVLSLPPGAQGGRPLGAIFAENIRNHLERSRRAAEEELKTNPPRKLDLAAIPMIELDASHWRNVLDFYGALKKALGSPEGHGSSPDAWVDSMIYGGMNAVEPPYIVRIIGTADCPAGLLKEINLLADVIRDARAWKLQHYAKDVEVGFRIEL